MTGQSDTEQPDEATHYSGSIDGARVLIVDEHANLRKMLVDLVKEQTGIEFCLEAETADVASRTIDGQAVDFALVDISSNPRRGARLAERLRLRCPKLPVMSVTIEGKPVTQAIHKADISPEQIETILAGIRYMQSLIRAGLSGFTVCIET